MSNQTIMHHSLARFSDHAQVTVLPDGHDPIAWRTKFKVEKFWSDELEAMLAGRKALKPYDVVEGEGNLLTTVGATALFTKLIGGAGTVFDNTNGYLGVGDSSTAETTAQTDLQASSNKLRKAMDATYPIVTTNTCVWRSTFATSDANFAWNEWGVFNASSAGSMLNRKVQSLGTKASGATWILSITNSLA